MTNAYNDTARELDPCELLAHTAVRRLEEMGCTVLVDSTPQHSTVTGPFWPGPVRLAGAILFVLTVEAAAYVGQRQA